MTRQQTAPAFLTPLLFPRKFPRELRVLRRSNESGLILATRGGLLKLEAFSCRHRRLRGLDHSSKSK